MARDREAAFYHQYWESMKSQRQVPASHMLRNSARLAPYIPYQGRRQMYLPNRYAPARCLALTQSEGILSEADGLLAAGQLRKWAPLPSTSAFQLLPVIP